MKKALTTIIALFLLASCSDKEIKPVTEESMLAQEAFDVAEELRNAYLNKNLSALEKNSTKEGYRELLGAIKIFDKAELNFESKWIEIEKSTVSLRIAWSGTWILKGHETKERGTAVFVFEGNPLKLSAILRANPFRQPE